MDPVKRKKNMKMDAIVMPSTTSDESSDSKAGDISEHNDSHDTVFVTDPTTPVDDKGRKAYDEAGEKKDEEKKSISDSVISLSSPDEDFDKLEDAQLANEKKKEQSSTTPVVNEEEKEEEKKTDDELPPVGFTNEEKEEPHDKGGLSQTILLLSTIIILGGVAAALFAMKNK